MGTRAQRGAAAGSEAGQGRVGPSSPWDPLTSEGAVAAQDAEAAGLAGTGAPREDTRRAGRGHCGRGPRRVPRRPCPRPPPQRQSPPVCGRGGQGGQGLLRRCPGEPAGAGEGARPPEGQVARARTLPCEAPGVSRARDCTPHPHPISAALAGSSEDSFQSKGIKSKENAHITALL